MNKPARTFLFFALFALGSAVDTKPPETEITNGLVTAKLYLPDADHGYYRGTRFDWAGVVYDLTYKNHHYFGKWFDHYEPTLHDAIMGPVDAFDPIGYDSAKTGESFLKIGVGLLEKPEEEKYTFSKTYKLLNGGKWRTSKKQHSVHYTHDFKNGKYQYLYTKTLTLTEGKPELIIEHTLKNNGSDAIETNVFNHNFFVMDQQPTGPDFVVKFPFTPNGELKGKPAAAAIDGNKIVYKDQINKGEYFAISPLSGYGESANDYDLRVENTKTKTVVRIIGDRPIVKFVYWSAPSTLCPEPYIHISVAPGQATRWRIAYEFSAQD
ncbi:MAG: hypothetical protein ABJA70_17370 [Chryseolinea sp.]